MNQTKHTCGECKYFDAIKVCTFPKWQVYEKSGRMSNDSDEIKKSDSTACTEFEPRDDTKQGDIE